jgi:hypothetical protein
MSLGLVGVLGVDARTDEKPDGTERGVGVELALTWLWDDGVDKSPAPAGVEQSPCFESLAISSLRLLQRFSAMCLSLLRFTPNDLRQRGHWVVLRFIIRFFKASRDCMFLTEFSLASIVVGPGTAGCTNSCIGSVPIVRAGSSSSTTGGGLVGSVGGSTSGLYCSSTTGGGLLGLGKGATSGLDSNSASKFLLLLEVSGVTPEGPSRSSIATTDVSEMGGNGVCFILPKSMRRVR